ncbi:response regulator [Paenibacillus cymbidii]|uniref:response regulator n=1 Tax=Paenibacillus cymbidii TaxID=1639034 RepID=UPI0010807C94|nr:response regulator [Paenibacillus cymbidii]
MIRVLLVDDEEDALDLLEILLGQLGGIEVVGRYVNPLQAIDALSRSSVDAVFLDNQMPGMKGMEAARIIRQSLPKIPIVFTTAYAEYAVEAFEVQTTDYLLKPFTIDRLQSAVARIKQSSSDAVMQARQSEQVLPTIQCLGGFRIQLPGGGNKILPWRTKKARELCAFLIHHEGKSVATATIIESLWPGHDLNKAKAYLYTCLSYLRKSFADHNIPFVIHKADQGFYAVWDGMTVDVAEFEQLLGARLSEGETDERLYDKMNQIGKGEYMEACDFGWAASRQLSIKAAYIQALRRWSALFRDKGKSGLAIDSMQRVLAIAPDSEADGRELIKLHLEAGNRTEAHRVYTQLEQTVRVQLEAELEEETVNLFQMAKKHADRQAR